MNAPKSERIAKWARSSNLQKNFMLIFKIQAKHLVIRARSFKINQSANKCEKTEMSNQNEQNSLSQSRQCKNSRYCFEHSIFEAASRYQDLADQCKQWFNNIEQLYEAISKEKNNETISFQNRVYIKFFFQIKMKNKSFKIQCPFILFEAGTYNQNEFNQLQPEMENKQQINSIDEQIPEQEVVSQYSRIPNQAQKANNFMSSLQYGHQAQNIQAIFEQRIGKIQKNCEETAANTQRAHKRLDNVNVNFEQIIKLIDNRIRVVARQMRNLDNNHMYLEQKFANFTHSQFKIGQLKYQGEKEIPINYKFSVHKNQNIKLITPNIAKCYSQDNSLKIALIQPLTMLVKKYIEKRIFKISFKIKEMKNYIAVGVCQKEIVKALSYRQMRTDIKNHGCYLMDWDGDTWSNYERYQEETTRKGACFTSGDIVRVIFRPRQKLLKFFKNNCPRSVVTLMLNPNINLNDICFCVVFNGDGDEVEILQTGQNQVIDLVEQEQVGIRHSSNSSFRLRPLILGKKKQDWSKPAQNNSSTMEQN